VTQMTSNKYVVRYIVPRDIELSDNLNFTSIVNNVQITVELTKRISVAGGMDNENSTATIVGNDDMHGNIHKTEFETTILLSKFIDSKFKKDDRTTFLVAKSIEQINKLIAAHQYVNDKYFVFPISKRELSDIFITNPDGRGSYIMSPAIKMITFGDDELIENSKKVTDFLKEKQEVFGPVQMFGYARQFYNMEIYRIALTEAQAAIEYLLDLIITKSLTERNDDSLKFYNKTKIKSNLVDEKLGIHLRLATGIAIEDWFENIKDLSSAVSLRNDIVHGEKSQIDKTEASSAMRAYKKLFGHLVELWTP